MNCREHQEFFSDLYDGNLPADRGRELEAHLSGCDDCRGEYEAFSASLKALQEAGERAVPEAFVRRVMDTARAESERQVLYQNTGMRRPSTRRMVVPKRAVWAIPAIAAAALVAFAVGYFIQKQAADRAIEQLKNDLANNPAVDKGPIAAPEEGVVWLAGKRYTTDQYTELILGKLGIVKDGAGLMAREIKEHLDKGEMLVEGKWMSAKGEVDRRVQEELAKSTGAPDPRAIEDRVIEKLGLVKRGGGYLSKAMAEALDRGLVVSPTGEALSLDELVADKLHELKLVRHEGRWMSEEQRTELLASRRIERPGGVANTAVTRALDGLEIGPPLGYKNLTLYPLFAAADKTVAVTTLPEALGAGKVDVTDELNSLQVRVKNKGDADLVLLAGEILVGGRTDRVVARDTIVAAKKTVPVEVFDIEPGQLRGPEKPAFRPESGHYWASLGMRRLLNEEPGQAGVWAAILGSGSRGTPVDLYREHRAALFEYRMALVELKSAQPLMVGAAIAVGDSLVSAEIFGSPALFAASFDRILESASLEAILAGPGRESRGASEFPSSVAAVKRMLETTFLAEQDAENDAIVVRRHGRALGRAVTGGGEAVRLLLFPDGSSAPRPPLDLAVQPAKVKRAVDGYEARLDSATGPRRASILREMAMLPGDYPRQKVLEHAKSDKARVPAIEALGLRGDPAVIEPLLEWLKETRKESSVALYAALAQALSRLGSEKAIPVLIQDLDPKTPQIARAAAEHLPPLMMGLRNLNTLETSMGALIQALERFSAEPSDPQGLSWPVRTLRFITTKEYGRILDFQNWWNTPLERANFLEQRRHP